MAVALSCVPGDAFAQAGRALHSPDGTIELRIGVTERLSFDLLVDGQPVIRNAALSMVVDDVTLGAQPKVRAASHRSVSGKIEPAVRQKSKVIREAYNELRLEMEENYAVVFRAYDEGVAYRFETALPRNEVKVREETMTLAFAGEYVAYYPKEEGFFSHNEREFVHVPVKEIDQASLASVPVVVETTTGVRLAIADSAVEDYPGLWLRGTRGGALSATFPPYPLAETLEGDRDFKVTKAADYIAVTAGKRSYPWRLVGVARKDGDLLLNPLVHLLARPSELQDTSWIKPGKVAWDWYNANNLYGVDFKAGINTETYKYYIDFAAKHGVQYVILDEGWYKLGNLLEVVPGMDIVELVAYGRQRNVGIIPWVVWKTLDDQFEPAFAQFEKWGVAGLKVDFMQRDDQKVIGFYHRVSREAARRRMLVDFHGAIRPATMTRTWPNLITAEGVRGLEQNKWGTFANPEHNVTLPFTRMFLGPMDYTPGAMVNGAKASFAPIFERPMSMGTRCHQLAMYVVYESPLQMLADSPSHYLAEPQIMEFLGPVPSVWDETRVLAGRIGDFVAVARRSGTDWYLGAMTDWTPRKLEIDLSFMPGGAFEMDAYEDGVNADRYGSDYRKVTRKVDRSARFTIAMAPGGGWAARIRPAR